MSSILIWYKCKGNLVVRFQTWNDGLVQNWEWSMTRLYIVTRLFNLCSEYYMQNTRLDDSQAILKISESSINSLRYATLMPERKEKLKILLLRVKKENENSGLKLSIQNTKIMTSGPITSWQIEEEKVETVSDFIFLGFKITADCDCSHEINKHLLLRRKAMTNLDRVLKSRDITLPTKVHIVKAVVFLVVEYGCES